MLTVQVGQDAGVDIHRKVRIQRWDVGDCNRSINNDTVQKYCDNADAISRVI